ncbi:MAG: response regulator [candidate division WOR-3 bacterium]|nr:response regulator [candidate division WOR-3 bacterium]MCX7757003.1 response regulator [candidate division WOR-3 bacterium]MDW7988340.1 response regulator [candidate division WOR-3 bacterium]
MQSILLVEDDKNLSEIVKFHLERIGFKVTVVTDGVSMFNELRQAKPDLIILDIMLPGLDGYKLCGLLKNYEPYKDIPIIIFTARTGEDAQKLAQEMGCDAFLTKPFNPTTLLSTINRVLKQTEFRTSII